jgi:hypothetical protein
VLYLRRAGRTGALPLQRGTRTRRVTWACCLTRAAREPIGASPYPPEPGLEAAVERHLGTLPGSASIVTFSRQNGKCQFEPQPGRGFRVL